MAARPDERGMRPDPRNSPLSLGYQQTGLPGNMGLLTAMQMNQGFGGGLLSHKRAMTDIYDPVNQLPPFQPGQAEGQGQGQGGELYGKLAPWLQMQQQQMQDPQQFMEQPSGAGDWPGKVNLFKSLTPEQQRRVMEQFMSTRQGMTPPNLGMMGGNQ